ncbi:hypothetical protein FF011L_29710 [Roseimaritima multifibrata]|uniref:PHP domain protein n=1 Tax=Roseimaritima multifibrata TaxID=1930274 RepID=A0A517MH29_9BACT|nr:hypothetical protein [Roseimaritima multifibrata]QDS94193.1 hypothetical protein FF011L_29710 [Roseimaritima multifibrata]
MKKSLPLPLFLLLTATALLPATFARGEENDPPARWWKGNIHTHSLWSDGNDFPEMIADWYRQQDYNFLALTDHNVLAEGQRWMPFDKIVARSDAEILDRYQNRFGDSWVETRGEAGTPKFEVRLKPLDEFRSQLETHKKFILIPAEEISDGAEGKPVHINATNIAEAIPPAGGDTVREVMQNNLRAILAHEKSHGRHVLPHINHPNFHYAITADDLAAVVSERFFEVYNGHPGVHHEGDEDHPSIERMWDLANAIRRTNLNVPPLMGLGTDDSHNYNGHKGASPGRGWVMVRSKYLSPEHLIKAMKAGDFYASSGVTLKELDYAADTKTLSLEIAPQEGATYKTQFIGTLKPTENETPADAEKRVGKVLKTAEGLNASYKLTGDELYVRAVVTSDQAPVNPSFKNQKQQVWTQPIGWE